MRLLRRTQVRPRRGAELVRGVARRGGFLAQKRAQLEVRRDGVGGFGRVGRVGEDSSEDVESFSGFVKQPALEVTPRSRSTTERYTQ